MKNLSRKILLFALILLLVCSLSAFQTAEEAETLTTEEQTQEESSVQLNPMTGLPVSNPSLLNLPPVFIPLARYPSTLRPSSGHSQAQWVFEMYAGDGESRPILMFYGELPAAPISHLTAGMFGLEELRRQYGGIIVMGGTMRSVLDSGIRSYELWYGVNFDSNYPELPAGNYQHILNKWAKVSTPADPNNLRYEFDEEPPAGGRTANSLFFRYNIANQILWVYDPESGKYMRGQNSAQDQKTIAADVDSATGTQIGVENLFILMAPHEWVEDFPEEYGFFTVTLNFIDSCPAVLFRDGKMYNITWTTKNTAYEQESGRMRPIRFLDGKGNSFPLKPGQTWVHVVMPGNPIYEVDEELGSHLKGGSGFWKLPYIGFKPGSQEQVEAEVEELKLLEYALNASQ